MNLINTYYHWKNLVDWINVKRDKILQPQKRTFWGKSIFQSKTTISHFTTILNNFALKIKTDWATRMVKSILKTRNVSYDAC